MNIKDISISKLFRDQFNLLNKSTGESLELMVSKLDTKQFLDVVDSLCNTPLQNNRLDQKAQYLSCVETNSIGFSFVFRNSIHTECEKTMTSVLPFQTKLIIMNAIEKVLNK